jgi:phosphomannomutase
MKTVLFDMDGTLTEERSRIDINMIYELAELSKIAKIGIVTGSDMKYIREQCGPLWDTISGLNTDNVLILPCNGTKMYEYSGSKYEKTHDASMEEELGTESYGRIIHKLLENQIRLRYALFGKRFPLTGNFIDCRGSMINWCPIGRNATKEQRKIWQDLDRQYGIREQALVNNFNDPAFDGVEIKLGGSTSFDIFPTGWDKTYALRHVNPEECYFLGDRCFESGNDRQIYEKIKQVGLGAYSVSSPSETIKILEEKIIPSLEA